MMQLKPIYPGYFADPFVWRHEGVWFAVGTGVIAAEGETDRVTELLTAGGAPGVFLRGGKQKPQFFLGMDQFGLAGRFDADSSQQVKSGAVQRPDERIGGLIEEFERPGDP